MNAINITCIAILSVLLGLAGPAYGQSEQGEKQNHPGQQQNKPDQQHAQQQRQANQKQHQPQHPEQRQDQDQHPQQAQQQQRQDRTTTSSTLSSRTIDLLSALSNSNAPSRPRGNSTVRKAGSLTIAPGSNAAATTDTEFPTTATSDTLGQTMDFAFMDALFSVVGGYPRFQYSGYWFSMVDPWPEYWANDWYDTDDVYVTYVDNGYYLFNRRHPQTGIAINISL